MKEKGCKHKQGSGGIAPRVWFCSQIFLNWTVFNVDRYVLPQVCKNLLIIVQKKLIKCYSYTFKIFDIEYSKHFTSTLKQKIILAKTEVSDAKPADIMKSTRAVFMV